MAEFLSKYKSRGIKSNPVNNSIRITKLTIHFIKRALFYSARPSQPTVIR